LTPTTLRERVTVLPSLRHMRTTIVLTTVAEPCQLPLARLDLSTDVEGARR